MMYYDNKFIHPITGFKTYGDKPTKIIPSVKKTKNEYNEPLEKGIELVDGKFLSFYKKGTYKKHILGLFDTVEEARLTYKNYVNTKTLNEFVKFCIYKNSFYTKINNTNIWSRKGETEQQFLKRIGL